ncbi:partner and localizer of BRCA2 [Mantella aurantiaca]
MENVSERCLTLEDKAKIKERLALLKKEYKRTVNRLQKSERAERVKIHVKRTIEEQNRLLSQQYTGEDSALPSPGPENCTSNASGGLEESHKVSETPSANKERKPCVSFNLEPEIVNSDSRTPPCSAGESSGQEAEGNRAHPSSQIFRSRLRLSRSARRVCFSESPSPRVFHVNSIVGDGEKSAADHSLSPVFKKHPADAAPLRPDIPTSSYCVEDAKPEDVGPSGTALFQLGTADNSPGEVRNNYGTLQSVGAEITTPNELVPHCVETKEEQPLPASESLGAMSSTCGLMVTPPRELEGHIDLKMTSQASPPLSPHNQPPPNLNVEEDHNPLSSCTLVEGLLFPVEYYVRTTRRMTSCQRKVDLDAVISSHLVTGRRGSRGRSRRNSTSLSTPITIGDKLSNSMTPLSRPSVSSSAGEVARSRRGRGRKSCPAVISSGLKDVSVQLKFDATPSGSQSEKENCDEVSASKESPDAGKGLNDLYGGAQIKGVERLVTLRSNKKAHSPQTRESSAFKVRTLAGDEEGKSNFKNSKEAYGPTGLPLPLLSGTVSLDRLSHCLKMSDFHLPDEDFGILKLEKLKSANHLERFTRGERRERGRHPKNDCATMPPAGISAPLQEVNLRDCSQKPEGPLERLGRSEQYAPCSNGSPLGNNREQPSEAAHCLMSTPQPPQSPLSRLSPVIRGVLPSKDTTSHSPKIDFTVLPSPEEDNPGHAISIPDHEIPRAILPDPAGSSNHGEAVDGAAEILGANLDPHRRVEPDDVTSQSKMPPKLSSPKELTGSVLFSTSLCSVPLESMNDMVASSCTPRLPYLGSTPAVFSSPQGSRTPGSPRPVHEGGEVVPSPEDGGGRPGLVSPGGLHATEDTEDAKQCRDVLGQDSDTEVKGHCDHQETRGLSKTEEEGSAQVISDRAADEDTELGIVSGGHLRLLSQVKAGGCAVDLCPVWWEFSGSTELCIVSASESSVWLWRPQAEANWECAHIWSFTEMPVIQILPLSQEKNIVCVALGNLEIMEIWALFSPPQRIEWEKQPVKRGHMNIAHGLARLRLVTSGHGEDGQVVEVQQLSETGSTVESISLVPPRDRVLAFCEVEGERDALVGSTMNNCIAVWNSVTGHLLSVVCVGDHCADLTCLSATSDSGLLFLVVGSLLSKPCEDAGSCIFELIAVNPRGGTSALIMNYFIPDNASSRYLEGDVKRQKAAAVLTCGSIALWDLPRSHCSITLSPSLDAPWCLVRWSHSPSHLLAGRKDGTLCVYEYTDECSDEKR